jgi:alkanesulfonate monooxygenase SsuD/methylene tetrahydromethanopterin reductase-like flavin-dependent oxidoreductase (luciferase family)
MEVGVSVLFQNCDGRRTDRQVYERELALADLVEPLGFDAVWTTEHHFTDYMLVPDPLQFLTYMAARTSRVRLGSMVVVLPWHDPIRVAEQVSVLDHMSNGRVILGVGRGAGDVEFEGFRVPMGESRQRFVEAMQIVMQGLEEGVCEFSGTHLQQPRRAVRPAPWKSFRGRAYAATLSPDSAEIMARLGLGLMIIPQKPWEQVAEEQVGYRALYRQLHGSEPPATIAAAWVYCDRDPARAREMAMRHIGAYYRSTIAHYRFTGSHFARTKGYEFYDKIARNLASGGVDKAAEEFVQLQVWGTPEQCYERVRAIQGKIVCRSFNAAFSYAGMPYEAVEASMRLFAAEVLPALQRGA